MIRKVDAIESLRPRVGYSFQPSWDSEGVETGTIVEWDSDETGATKPTDSEINTEVKRLQVIWDAQEYARNRKWEYNQLNQFELMTDDAANSTTTHADAITVIKTKWPKANTGPIE